MRIHHKKINPKILIFLFFLLLFPYIYSKSDTLIVAIDGNPVSLDPRIGYTQVSEHVYGLIFNSLVKYDKNLNIVPDLAEKWEIEGYKKFTFYLKKGVKFQDGRELTSKDIAYTFLSLKDKNFISIKKRSVENIEKIVLDGKYKITFILKKPDFNFFSKVISPGIGIVEYGSPKDVSQNPIGTGPFKLINYKYGERIVLKRNEDYFGEKPKIKKLILKIIPDESTIALELRKGSVDCTINTLSPDTIYELKKEKNLLIKMEKGTNYQYIGFNMKDKYLKNKDIRKAIAYGLNLDEIIKYLYRGYVERAYTILPPQHPFYSDKVIKYNYNPQLAKKFLKKTHLKKITLEYKASTNLKYLQQAQVFQYQLKKIGINLKISSFEFATVISDIINGNFQMYSLMWIGANLTDDFFYDLFYSKNTPPNGYNRGRFSNKEMDLLLLNLQNCLNVAERKKINEKIQYLISDELPYISLWYVDTIFVGKKNLKDIELDPTGSLSFLTTIHW